MNRGELPQEASREDKMRDALKHYEELATKACWHRSDIPDAIRAYYASLPPAEGAESAEAFIKRKHPQDWDEIPQWHIDELNEFAAQPQPTAEGAEEILTKHLGSLMPLKYGVKYNKMIDAMREFATLHAQRIAEKMVDAKTSYHGR